MEPITRRTMLVGGAAGAAVGLTGVAHASPSANAAPLSDTEMSNFGGEPALILVRDAAAGEIEILVGEREITRKDRSLVASLVRSTN